MHFVLKTQKKNICIKLDTPKIENGEAELSTRHSWVKIVAKWKKIRMFSIIF